MNKIVITVILLVSLLACVALAQHMPRTKPLPIVPVDFMDMPTPKERKSGFDYVPHTFRIMGDSLFMETPAQIFDNDIDEYTNSKVWWYVGRVSYADTIILRRVVSDWR